MVHGISRHVCRDFHYKRNQVSDPSLSIINSLFFSSQQQQQHQTNPSNTCNPPPSPSCSSKPSPSLLASPLFPLPRSTGSCARPASSSTPVTKESQPLDLSDGHVTDIRWTCDGHTTITRYRGCCDGSCSSSCERCKCCY